MAADWGAIDPRRRTASAVIAVALLAGALTPGAGASQRVGALQKGFTASDAAWVPGEVVVAYRAGAAPAERAQVRASASARVVERVPAFDIEVLRLARGRGVAAAVASLANDPRVAYAEPNFVYRKAELVPSDPLFGNLWGLQNTGASHPIADPLGGFTSSTGLFDADMDVTNAWDADGDVATPPALGTVETVVAVIDDGLQVAHPELSSQLWQNPGEAGGVPGSDDDGNGKLDDLVGWDVAHNDATLLAPIADNQHGTHVAGTIGAALGNGQGIAGVCPGCRLMAVKVMRDDGTITTGSLAAGVAYAKAEGADIANMSIGGPGWSSILRNAIRTSGLLLVTSAANDALDNDMFTAWDSVGTDAPDIFSPSYPASYDLPNVLTVAASNDRDQYGYATGCFLANGSSTNARHGCSFTNWGHDSVDLAAPGVDVTSTVPVNTFATWDGTSMAAPNAAGVAALVKSANPTWTPVQVKNAVMRGVDKPPALGAIGSPIFFGFPLPTGAFTRTSGRVNALNALTASNANATAASDGNVSGARSLGTSMSRSDRLGWPADANDVFKKGLRKGVRYRVTVDGQPNRDFDLLVYRPGTVEIWQLRGPCSTAATCPLVAASVREGARDETVVFRARATGTFVIHVNAWFTGGAYTLRIAKLAG